MMNKWSGGGSLAGLAGGFLLGGPIGAIAGAVGGYYLGCRIEPMPKTTIVHTVTGGEETVSVPKGSTIGVIGPTGGKIQSMGPGIQGGGVSTRHQNGWGVMSVTGEGDAYVLWSDSKGNNQVSHIKVTAT